MKKFIFIPIAILLMFSMFNTVETAIANHETPSQIAYDWLVTSHDPDRYSEFVIVGENRDVFGANGVYKDNKIVDFSMSRNKFDIDFKILDNGKYTATFTGTPKQDGYDVINITLESGVTMQYRIEYSVSFGWYFADWQYSEEVSLSERNLQVIAAYEQVSPAIAVQYLVGENVDYERTAAILAEIKRLAEEITEGIDDDYQKAKAISAWVAEIIHYDTVASANGVTLETVSLEHVVEYSRGICSGYANLTAAMYEAVDIKAVTVIGDAVYMNNADQILTKNNRHEWTAFWYEYPPEHLEFTRDTKGRWVIVDSGWDSLNLYTSNGYSTDGITQKYFDITPQALVQSHRAGLAEERRYFDVLETFDFGEASSSNKPNSEGEKTLPFNNNPESEISRDSNQAEESNSLTYVIIPLAVGAFAGFVGVLILMTILRKRKG
ncbi:MAG: transglutaminase-like domain-containing protein [Oscillospiraceae bacterium]|nr:transglutaminase-like domain-containing protein [Oscillospiraceae bacterium]